MAPTLCNRCGDAVEDGCDPRDELAELDALLERLRLKRYHLKKKINQSHSLIVRQLPPDVTSTIFEFCLPDFTDPQPSPYYHTEDADSDLSDSDLSDRDLSIPLSLGAICSYWRAIAWSTPRLWSSLVARVTSQSDSHIVASIAQEWLARSGQLPLSISISSSSQLDNEAVSALADIINQYSSRWSDLDIPDRYYHHFHATDNHAPILKSIRFRRSVEAIYLKFRLTCPRLERASFSFFSMVEIYIQWDNLTHLTVQFISIIDSFLVLRKTPRLAFFKVTSFRSHHREQSIGAPFPIITSLRSLQLTMKTLIDIFLKNIIAPHLEEFSLPNYYNPSMEVVTSFLRRSACSLRSFSTILSNLPPYSEAFMNLLQSMPSLNTLSIISTTSSLMYSEDTTPEDYDPRNILELVAKILSSQCTSLQQGFLPNLKILEYTGELYLHAGNYEDLYSLPPADNAVHGPLHLVKLDLLPVTRIPKNMISFVSRLVERGITVNVLCGSEDILQRSINYYRRKENSLGQDWADNFDDNLDSNLVSSLFS